MGALAIMCACNSKPSTEYTINGTTDIPDGETIYFACMVSNDSTYKDSCVVANGAFSFAGSLATPSSATSAVAPSPT